MLAIDMAIHVHGAAVPLAADALRSALPRAGQRLCLFVHGPGSDECQWRWEAGDQAIAAGMRWPASTRLLIWLGSLSLGSPLERLGHLANSALNLSSVTRPLGRIAATRSEGIKDLRRGPGALRASARRHSIAFGFLGASLAEDVDYPISQFLGDDLVPLGSAIAHEIEGDAQSARLGKLGHLRPLNDGRVYLQIREWVAGDCAYWDSRS